MVCIVIPSRIASTRLPNKPLIDICGKTMIERVYNQALKSKLAKQNVYIATCDTQIADVVEEFGGKYIMTGSEHTSGTDRIAEAVYNINCDIVINLQGDEPLVNPDYIDKLIAEFDDENINMASLMVPISKEEAENPNLVKVVCDSSNFAMYFSRSKIPYDRNEFQDYYGHIGIYGYRKDFLIEFSNMQQYNCEISESLEQLRVLENGYKIKMIEVQQKPIGVDTQEDYEQVCKILNEIN